MGVGATLNIGGAVYPAMLVQSFNGAIPQSQTFNRSIDSKTPHLSRPCRDTLSPRERAFILGEDGGCGTDESVPFRNCGRGAVGNSKFKISDCRGRAPSPVPAMSGHPLPKGEGFHSWGGRRLHSRAATRSTSARLRNLCCGLSEPGFETRLAESRVIARNQRSLA